MSLADRTRVPPPRRAATTLGLYAQVYDLWRELDARQVLAGRLVSGSISSATSVLVNHGLGREYIGAIVVGQSGTVALMAGRPEDTDSASGGDSSTNLLVQAGSSTSQSFNLWVF